jgi:hypothetical protein
LDRTLDVSALGGLVAAGEQNDHLAIPFGVVHPIAWVDLDLELGDALIEDAV